jgi:flagellar basal body-associated protein FliL
MTESNTQSDTLEQVSAIKKNTSVVSLLVLLAFLFLCVCALALYIWFGMQNTPVNQLEPTSQQTQSVNNNQSASTSTYTIEERLEVLESLESNPDNLSIDERRAILNSL